jgi:hypothetical protein
MDYSTIGKRQEISIEGVVYDKHIWLAANPDRHTESARKKI